MANETILIVDADTKSQKVLEVSFKKAGYRVVMTDGPARARELVQDVSPDIIISDTQFPSGGDGFDFLADVKMGASKTVPFIFLTEERALPQKMKGFELGADDYLTKPVYIKEVTTRVELLLQKRAKEQLTEDKVEELEGNVADITMIDMLQTIEEELRSGTIHLTREGQSAVIYFREGNILDAICGKLQGEEAIYRLMLWPDGEFILRYHDQVRRVDRIEKNSGALLLEGIRRLDQYNELVDELPGLHHVFEADYQSLSGKLEQLPEEVGRIVRLFDGLRSIREVADGSPVDDVTTLKIIGRLIEDGALVDVTPSVRSDRRSPSNLANWLDGARPPEPGSASGLGREDTSPKFGASITKMAEKRSEQNDSGRTTLESAQPNPQRDAHDTDPFGSRVQQRDSGPRRKTLPLKDAFETIDNWEDDAPRDSRRKTALQWDRPRSGWNIHFDAAADSNAAIREIEEEERRRREEEAKHISDVTRDATLRFAPAQDRSSGPDSGRNEETVRQIEEDERRRRQEEARRLQEQMQTLGLRDDGAAGMRRRTDELPLQSRVPAVVEAEEKVDTAELFGDERAPALRERKPTPLSSPAVQAPEEEVQHEPVSEGWEALAASSEVNEANAVSEADVFDDDSDEIQRAPLRPAAASERVTLDIRPPTKLSHLSEPSEPELTEVDPSGLFEAIIGDEETSPGGDDVDEIEIEVIEVLPTIERQATDNQLVRAVYDLSLRKSILPAEIPGRPESVAERETVELPAPRAISAQPAEKAFFSDGAGEHSYEYDEQHAGGLGGGWIAALVVAVLAVIGIVMFSGNEPVPPVVDPVANNTTAEPPPQTIAEPVEPPGLSAEEAANVASGYGGELGTSARDLTMVLSGADLMPDMGVAAAPDAGVVAVIEPPVEKPPVEKPPVEKPPVEKPPIETPPIEKPPVEKPDPAPAASASVKAAERLVKQEKFDEALPLLRQLSEADPKDKKVAYLHGLAAFSSNKNGEAVTNLARAERLGYRTSALYLDLAAAYQLDGKKDRAKWAYEKFLELQPNGRMADEVRTILSTRF